MVGIQKAYAQEKSLHPLSQKSIFAERLHVLSDEKDQTASRSPFARDRDRILLCKSFRRMAHKTQLYISHEGNEHNRTRLTHTVEVAQIAKTIAWNLSVNHELVEAIAFGHDVGHSPFGHAGERQINRFLKGMEPFPRKIREKIHREDGYYRGNEETKGDFRHNFQSIRVLTLLEKYHPDYDGMNLTFQCLEGILKHTKITPLIKANEPFDFPGINETAGVFSRLDLDKPYSTSIEGQIVSIADEIAQVTHDINDALRIGALQLNSLLKVEAIRNVIENDKMRYPQSIMDCLNVDTIQQAQVMSAFHNHFIKHVTDKLSEEMAKITYNPKVVKENQFKLNRFLLHNNTIDDLAFIALKKIKDDSVLNNFTVNRMDNKGVYFIRNLFESYINNPRQLPDYALDSYCQLKKKELSKLGDDWTEKWVTKKNVEYHISDSLSKSELSALILFLKEDADGHHFRLLPHDIVDRMLPYLAIDSDFIRVVSDHISSMTDKYAQEEYKKLFM